MQGYMTTRKEYVHLSEAERREFDRREFRTVGTVYLPKTGTTPARCEKVWTRDVSMTGAKLSVKNEIPESRMYLKLLLPQFKDTLLECEIVHRSIVVRQAINGKERHEHVYGVRFLQLLREEQFAPQLKELLELTPQNPN